MLTARPPSCEMRRWPSTVVGGGAGGNGGNGGGSVGVGAGVDGGTGIGGERVGAGAGVSSGTHAGRASKINMRTETTSRTTAHASGPRAKRGRHDVHRRRPIADCLPGRRTACQRTCTARVHTCLALPTVAVSAAKVRLACPLTAQGPQDGPDQQHEGGSTKDILVIR
eukprot:scaffold60387_cov70-Phaeocystis_antarctica.AAC.1